MTRLENKYQIYEGSSKEWMSPLGKPLGSWVQAQMIIQGDKEHLAKGVVMHYEIRLLRPIRRRMMQLKKAA